MDDQILIEDVSLDMLNGERPSTVTDNDSSLVAMNWDKAELDLSCRRTYAEHRPIICMFAVLYNFFSDTTHWLCGLTKMCVYGPSSTNMSGVFTKGYVHHHQTG